MASGIYQIQSIKKPERIYIGSSVDISVRWRVHEGNLLSNNHHNVIMQNHVMKHGFDDLLFSIIEFCPRENLIIREQFYIDKLKPWFNINPIAGSRLNSRHTSGTRLKMIRAAKSRIKRKKRDFYSNQFVKLGL